MTLGVPRYIFASFGYPNETHIYLGIQLTQKANKAAHPNQALPRRDVRAIIPDVSRQMLGCRDVDERIKDVMQPLGRPRYGGKKLQKNEPKNKFLGLVTSGVVGREMRPGFADAADLG